MRGPRPKVIQRARSLRQVDNEAEERLWAELRGRRLNGFKFVRQFPIGRYFADFACREALLVVEIDGSQHAASRYDRQRDLVMSEMGWNIARFWNGCVLDDRAAVLDTIVDILEGRIVDAVEAYDLRFVPAIKKDGG